MMQFRFILFLLMTLWASLGEVSAQDTKIRASVVTEGDLWVGQRVVIAVELLAPGFFSGVAVFDLPKMSGVLLIPPAGSPVVSNETMDGVSYTVQRHELSIIAQHAGKQVIPSFPVRFSFKRNPLDKDPVATSVACPSLTIETKAPPGGENFGTIISARNVTSIETWKPITPVVAKAGDAFTREITFSAPEVPGMAFPPFPAGQIEGLGIYSKAPEVLDQNERGALSGKRRDSITYVCERPGEFTIPAARLTWFDLDTHKLQIIDFPERKFSVAANPAMASAAQGTVPTGREGLFWLGTVALGGALGWLVWRKRGCWWPLVECLRPVHLQPLNPSSISARSQR